MSIQIRWISVFLRFRGIVLFSLFLWLLGATSAVWAGNTWPMYQGNASHTGYLPVSLNPSLFSLRWQKRIGTLDLNPVTAAEGLVFVSETGYFNDFNFYALDATTGNILWSKNYGRINSVNPPAYAYGNVYIQTGNHAQDTYLRAYKAKTGDLVFRSAHAAQWERYYAPTIYGCSVYVNGGYYGGMYAFNAMNGQQEWFRSLPQYDEWTPAVDNQWAYAYMGGYSPGLYVTNRLTGELVFDIPDLDFKWDGWSMNLAPVLGGANDVLAIHGGRLIRFDLVNRSKHWQISGNFTGQVSVAKGVVYAISSGALMARDQVTGNLLWAWEVPAGNLKGPLVVTDSHLFVQTASTVYAVDLETHNSVWSYEASGYLSISDGTLYIASKAGWLTAITLAPERPVKKSGVVIKPRGIRFKATPLGTSSTKPIVLYNRSKAPLEICGISDIQSPFTWIEPQFPLIIPPGEAVKAVIGFMPTVKGRVKQNIMLHSNDPNKSTLEIRLKGRGKE